MSQWSAITGRTGKGAFAIRTMMDFVETSKKNHLREVQQYVLDTFADSNDKISLQYIKNLIKELEQRHIWKKSTAGRKWFLTITDHGSDFKEFLQNTDWGSSIDTSLTPEDEQEKHHLFLKWIEGCHVLRSVDEREAMDNAELRRLHKIGMLNYLTYNPHTMSALEHPKHPGVWIIRPLRDEE